MSILGLYYLRAVRDAVAFSAEKYGIITDIKTNLRKGSDVRYTRFRKNASFA